MVKGLRNQKKHGSENPKPKSSNLLLQTSPGLSECECQKNPKPGAGDNVLKLGDSGFELEEGQKSLW